MLRERADEADLGSSRWQWGCVSPFRGCDDQAEAWAVETAPVSQPLPLAQSMRLPHEGERICCACSLRHSCDLGNLIHGLTSDDPVLTIIWSRKRKCPIHTPNCSLTFTPFYSSSLEFLPQVRPENWRWSSRWCVCLVVCLPGCVSRDGLLWTLCPTCPLMCRLALLFSGFGRELLVTCPDSSRDWELGNLEESTFLRLGAVEAQGEHQAGVFVNQWACGVVFTSASYRGDSAGPV